MDELFYENLEDGLYQLYDFILFEDAKYVGAPFNRIQYKKIRLPEGKGNIIYLFSDTFENIIKMIQNKYFSYQASYRRLFYPLYLGGTFMKKRFRYKVTNKRERDSLITTNTKLRPYPSRLIMKNETGNVFFACNDFYDNTKKIVNSLSIKRVYSEYISEMCRLMKENSPEAIHDKPGNGNRILIIDADVFKFTSSSKLSDVKSNPLYLLYLAFLRNRDLTKLNVDMDMLICSNNLFMKFNPIKLISKDWGNFRKGLFTICKQNLDDLTETFSDDEKKELEETTKDVIMSNIIKDRIKPFVKNVSGNIKAVLQDAVEKKVRTKVAEVVKKDEEIKKTQQEVQKKIDNKPERQKVDIKQSTIKDTLTKKKSDVTTNTSLIHRNVVKNPLSEREVSFFKTIAGSYTPLATPTNQTIEIEDKLKSNVQVATSRQDAFSMNPNVKKMNLDEDDFGDLHDDRYDSVDEDEVDIDKEKTYKDEFEDTEESIADDVQEVLQDEDIAEEVLDEIQSETVPIKPTNIVAPVNSERDKKLREEQKKVVVRSETIEQILERDTNNVKLEEKDLSKILHTTNQNLYKMKFANFEKTYLKDLFLKDIVSVFDSLKDKETPFYITNIDIKDTSTSLDYKDTWTVSLKDETGKKHTIKVDIPKFIDSRFMRIQGTKYMILKQNFYNPLVKDTPDVVILTTNFNKITMRRRATKSFSSIEKIFSLLKKSEDDKIFTIGDSSKTNLKYISSLEYDELSRRIFKFESDGCKLYFSRDYISENLLNDSIKPKGNEFFIGYEGKNPIYINEDTGVDRAGRTIINIIEQYLPEKYLDIYNKSKGPSQSMYAECKAAGQVIPVIACLVVWDGLIQTLQNMKINWRFIPNAKSLPPDTSSHNYIRFANGILEYEKKTFAELILNGITKLHPEQFTFEQANTEEFYDEFIYSVWGTYNGITELKHFKEFLIDPITKSVCKDMMLPDTPSGLLIHGVKLLCDNAFVSKASDKSYRVRSIEIIPAILYNHINAQYKAHIKSGRRLPMSIRQNCVLQTLVTDIPTVEAYSTLSPAIEVHKSSVISTKGFKGSNSEYSYDEEKRSYDKTSIGKLTTVTSAKNPVVGRIKSF